MMPATDEGRHGDPGKEKCRANNVRRRPGGRERIENREVRRPERLAEVARVRHERVREPRGKRYGRERHHSARARRDDQSDDAHRCRQHDERKFLRDERSGRHRPHATERPPVEEEEYERQCDDHRLGEEPERERDRNGREARPRRVPRIAGISPQRHKPTAGAEDILALRNPRYRFDVQRV